MTFWIERSRHKARWLLTVARKVDALNELLTARQQLSNLITYMDGKSGAEELIKNVLNDPALLQSLAAVPKPNDEDAG